MPASTETSTPRALAPDIQTHRDILHLATQRQTLWLLVCVALMALTVRNNWNAGRGWRIFCLVFGGAIAAQGYFLWTGQRTLDIALRQLLREEEKEDQKTPDVAAPALAPTPIRPLAGQ